MVNWINDKKHQSGKRLHDYVTPVWGDSMFSIRFHRVRRRVRRRNNFCLSRQNRFS